MGIETSNYFLVIFVWLLYWKITSRDLCRKKNYTVYCFSCFYPSTSSNHHTEPTEHEFLGFGKWRNFLQTARVGVVVQILFMVRHESSLNPSKNLFLFENQKMVSHAKKDDASFSLLREKLHIPSLTLTSTPWSQELHHHFQSRSQS